MGEGAANPDNRDTSRARARDGVGNYTGAATLRAIWRQYWTEHAKRQRAWQVACDASWQAWRDNPLGRPPVAPAPPAFPFPEVLRGLTCGARTRAGAPCKRTDLYRSGRCKLHGGRSTGPITAKGKATASRNAKRTP